jgi:hypothetical protein
MGFPYVSKTRDNSTVERSGGLVEPARSEGSGEQTYRSGGHCVPLTFPARLALSKVAFSSDSSHDRSHERAILMSTRKELFVHTEERDPHKGAMAPDMQHILADEAEINGGRRCCRSEENRGGT